jgi:hypothetical protein
MPERDFTREHALYSSLKSEWAEAWDFYRSGEAVIDPGRAITRASFAAPGLPFSDQPTDTTSEANRTRQRARSESVVLSSYIYPHAREPLAEYRQRAARADHYPIFRNIADIYVSATLRTEPSRDVAGATPDPTWDTYWDDVDRQGTNIGTFIAQALTLSLVFRHVFAVTDRPRVDTPAPSRAAQLARGERAYSYLVSPLDVPDWEVDETGALVWLQIREDEPQPHEPGFATKAIRNQYRIWYRDRWELWRRPKGGAWGIIDQDKHGVGEVPVAILQARRGPTRELGGDGMLTGLVRNDRSIFNRMSLLDEILYKQAFAHLFLPTDDAGLPGPVDVGPGVAIGYNSANGQPMMLSPDAALITAIVSLISGQMQAVRENHGVGRGKAEYSKEERSAEALQVESRNENNRVAMLAASCEEFDRALHRHVAAWEGRADAPRAEYSRDVSLRSVSRQLADATSLKALGLPWEVLQVVVAPMVAEMMKEQGRSKESIAEALTALLRAPSAQAAWLRAPSAQAAAVDRRLESEA